MRLRAVLQGSIWTAADHHAMGSSGSRNLDRAEQEAANAHCPIDAATVPCVVDAVGRQWPNKQSPAELNVSESDHQSPHDRCSCTKARRGAIAPKPYCSHNDWRWINSIT